MSTDEEGSMTQLSSWRILKKEGRSDGVTETFRIMDASGRIWEERYGQKSGSEFRFRYESNKISKNDFYIKGLPLNAYDQEWLANLSRLERKKLNTSVEQYDLSINPAFLK